MLRTGWIIIIYIYEHPLRKPLFQWKQKKLRFFYFLFDPMDARIYFSNQGLDEEDTKQIKTIDDAMTLVILR